MPDAADHRRRIKLDGDPRLDGIQVAEIVDAALAGPADVLSGYLHRFHGLRVPSLPNDHIAAAAKRVPAGRAHDAGMFFATNASDRCAVKVGLALLATVSDPGDTETIKTLGLLSNQFGSLASAAVQKRPDSIESLRWLAERSSGWARVDAVERLCRIGVGNSRDWLLRESCNGEYLNSYFAGKVATAAYLDEAIAARDADDPLIDHTGRLLAAMTRADGHGLSLRDFPPALRVVTAFANHATRGAASFERYTSLTQISNYVNSPAGRQNYLATPSAESVTRLLASILNEPKWLDVEPNAAGSGD